MGNRPEETIENAQRLPSHSTEFSAAVVDIGGLSFTFAQANCTFTQDKIIGQVVIVGGYVASRTHLKGKRIDAVAQPDRAVVAKAKNVVVEEPKEAAR